MEEVWKDVSLSSLNDATTTNPTFHSLIFQEFLARPGSATRSSGVSGEETNFFCSLSSPTPATILSSKSGSEPAVRPNPGVVATNNNTSTAFHHGFGSSTAAAVFRFPPICRERVQEENDENSEDRRRQKLMMKNRESAARSRARRLAHTRKLELEVVRLRKENAKLRKHQEKLLAAQNQVPKKNSLRRSLTAPF